MPARVLLLGGDGQLGRDIRRAHGEAGEPFTLLAPGRGEIALTDSAALRTALGDIDLDVIVNCAAYNRVDEAEGDRAAAFAVNARAVGALADIAHGRGARLVHVSTDYVFGGDRARRDPIDEAAPRAPVNVYGCSKAAGERAAIEACDDHVVLRVASLFGVAGLGGRGGNFIETMIRLARSGAPIRVVDDQVMSPTSTRDVAGVVVRLLEAGAPAGIYHLVNRGAASWHEFATAIFEMVGAEVAVSPCTSDDFAASAPRPAYSVLDATKIERRFGPLPHWREALRAYLVDAGHLDGP